jgi:multidrug efflux pump subunit AcrA (membrane-fusion protein)
MMTIHGEEKLAKSISMTARITRVLALVVVMVAVILGITYRDSLATRLSRVFAAADDDPVPVARLSKEPYDMTVPATGEIVGLESVPVPTPSTPSGSLKVSWLVPEGTFVQPGDVVVRYDNTDEQLNLEKQQNTMEANQQRSMITTSSQSTNEKVLALDQKDAELDYDYAMTVLPQDETIFSKWDIIEAQINAGLSKEKLGYLQNKGKVQQRVARADQQILAIERNKAQNEITLTKQTLNSSELRTPAGGLVLWRRDRRRDPQVGDESQPGQVLVEVVNLEVLQARIYVLERDGGHLAKGQEILIRLDAIPEKIYHGAIRSVSATSQALERNSPLRYFTCDVGISDAGSDIKRIRPGMYVRGDVLLEKYESCFVVPASAVTEKKEGNVVYVQKGDRFIAKPVEVGLGSHGQAIILKGVDDGEIVALRNPFEERKLSLPDFSKATAGRQRGPGGPGGGQQMPGGGGRGGR